MRKVICLIFLFSVWAISCKKDSEQSIIEDEQPAFKEQSFKVVGYIWSRANIVDDLNKIDLDKITHLNIAFINPDETGIFQDVPALHTVVQIAHKKGVRVLMSCGGGSSQAYYARLLEDDKRPVLVNNFIDFVDKYQLDGIDVDLEGDDIDANYEAFILDLRNPLADRNKLLTSALAWWTRNRITNVALAQFDFINVMAYDATGPWDLNNPGQHSPYSYAQQHLSYWHNQRGVEKKNIVLGVPFYGYGFGQLPESNSSVRQMSWQTIQQNYPNHIYEDEIVFPNNGGVFYYNGITTIEAKTELAVEEGGGIMIWQLLYDSFNENSLLDLIDKTHKGLKN